MKHNPTLFYLPHALVLGLILALVVVSCFPIPNICLSLTLRRLGELWVPADAKAPPRSCLLDGGPLGRRDLSSIEALCVIADGSPAPVEERISLHSRGWFGYMSCEVPRICLVFGPKGERGPLLHCAGC